MQILDGKNHRRGAYEKFVLPMTVELLNAGRFWDRGRVRFPPIANDFTPEAVRRADEVFLKTFRALIDQWIDSGINADRTETPSARYVRGLPPGYSESLFDVLYRWLSQNAPKHALMNDGRIAVLDSPPHLNGPDVETYAREMAVYYLRELLESPAPHRLGRCRNPQCGAYFARKRAHKGQIKRGLYCGKCLLVGAAERTRNTRQCRRNKQLSAAATAWSRWKKSNRHPRQAEWVAQQVNQQCGRWSNVQVKWVTQNRAEILRRVEAHG